MYMYFHKCSQNVSPKNFQSVKLHESSSFEYVIEKNKRIQCCLLVAVIARSQVQLVHKIAHIRVWWGIYCMRFKCKSKIKKTWNAINPYLHENKCYFLLIVFHIRCALTQNAFHSVQNAIIARCVTTLKKWCGTPTYNRKCTPHRTDNAIIARHVAVKINSEMQLTKNFIPVDSKQGNWTGP